MKKVFKRIFAAVMAAVSVGTSFISVSAENGTYGPFTEQEFHLDYYNEDGSFNETSIDFIINAYCSESAQMMKLWRISRKFFKPEDQEQLYDYKVRGSADPDSLSIMKELVTNRIETECVDGRYYAIIDGKKVEYYCPDEEKQLFYCNLAHYFVPTNDNTEVIRPVGAMSITTDYDTLSYIQKYELWYKICMMQKDSIVFDYAMIKSSDEFIDNFNNERYDEIVKSVMKDKMEEYSDVPNDTNGNGAIDSEDALIVMQYAVSNNYSVLADVDNDGKVTSYDALLLLKKTTDSNE